MNRSNLTTSLLNLTTYFVIATAAITQLIWILFLQYPPTTEQIGLGIHYPLSLWLARITSLALLLLATFLFTKPLHPNARPFFWLLVIISPTTTLIWATHPLASLKILCLSLSFYLLSQKRINWIISTLTAISSLLLINFFLLHQKPDFLPTLSLKNSANEVMVRFSTEDSIRPHIPLPLPLKRLAYNKFFITLKNLSTKSLSFFDAESLFFQEIHPQATKSAVIFYWPAFLLFLLSLYLLVTHRISAPQSVLLPTFFIAFSYFLLENGPPYKKLLPLLFLLSLPMASALSYLKNSHSKGLKISFFLLLLATLYGLLTHLYDRQVRPLFWLDNRPILYQKLTTLAQNHHYQNYRTVYLSDTVGGAASYCRYFLGDCSSFVFANFNLTQHPPQPDTLYLGLAGNFYGPNSSNTFPEAHAQPLSELGLTLLATDTIPDNIANNYSQDLIVAATSQSQ